MFKVKFSPTKSSTANTYAVDRLPQGYVVKFDVGRSLTTDDNSLEIVLEDSNNDYGRKYPYTIRFAVHTDRNGVTTVKPIVSKSLQRDFGRFGSECIVDQFYRKLWRQMG